MWCCKFAGASRGIASLSKFHTASIDGVIVRGVASRSIYQQQHSRQVPFQHHAAWLNTASAQQESGRWTTSSVAAFLASAGISLSAYMLWKNSQVLCEEPEAVPDTTEPLPEIPIHAQYLLIGGGTAAASAVKGIRSRNPKAQILIVTEESFVPYKRPPLSKEFWYKENEYVRALGSESIFHNPASYYCSPRDLPTKEEGGVACLSDHKVWKLDASAKKAYLSNGSEISYDKCLLATGGRPRNLAIFENADEEVKKRTILFRNLGDFQKLMEASEGSKSVAVVGGGFLGSELACGLGHKGMHVYQVFPESGNLGNVLPEYVSKMSSYFVQKEGVEVIPDQSVEAVSYQDGQVQLTLTNKASLLVDVVVVAVGLEPNTDLAKTSGLEVDRTLGGYLVNAELEARSNVWVAGDAACFYDIKLGRRRVEHHVHAMMSGKFAGENMAGASKPYIHQSMFWSDLGPDCSFEAVGIIDSALQTTSLFGVKPGEKMDTDDVSKVQGVIFYKRDGIVVGVILWNISDSIKEASKLIAMDASDSQQLVEAGKKFLTH